MTRMNGSMGVALAALILSSLVSRSAIGSQAPTELRSARTVNEGGTILVIVEASGPLPMPTHETLENPPRLFLDFANVLAARRGVVTTPGAGVVRQTRIARFSPSVTRVVLDLIRLDGYQIDASESAAGRIKIVVGNGSTTAPAASPPPSKPMVRPQPPVAATAPPAPALAPLGPLANAAPKATPKAPPAAASVPAPAVTAPPASETPATSAPPGEPTSARRRPAYTPPPSAPKPPARAVSRYRDQLPGVIERMEAQQPILVLLDAEGSISAEALEAAMTELTSLRRLLDQFRPPEALTSVHQLLIAYCTLGATASRLGMEASNSKSVETRKNAASAAAGALMFFDRACADLGCSRPQH